MKTLVLGIGNTIRGNDGVGIEAVRRLGKSLKQEELFSEVDIRQTQEAGFSLLSLMFGYSRAIIIDSVQSKDGKPGNIYCFTKKDLKLSTHRQFSHNTGIPAVLGWAERAKAPLPEEIIFYLVEIVKCDAFEEGLSKEVEEAIPRVIELIKNHICE